MRRGRLDRDMKRWKVIARCAWTSSSKREELPVGVAIVDWPGVDHTVHALPQDSLCWHRHGPPTGSRLSRIAWLELKSPLMCRPGRRRGPTRANWNRPPASSCAPSEGGIARTRHSSVRGRNDPSRMDSRCFEGTSRPRPHRGDELRSSCPFRRHRSESTSRAVPMEVDPTFLALAVTLLSTRSAIAVEGCVPERAQGLDQRRSDPGSNSVVIQCNRPPVSSVERRHGVATQQVNSR